MHQPNMRVPLKYLQIKFKPKEEYSTHVCWSGYRLSIY